MTTKILYIDDDYGLIRLAQKAFARAGCEIVHAADVETGLARLEEGGISAIILDHYLKGQTGLDLLKTLNQRRIDTPVVYVTGSSEATIAVEALKAGAADYVIKTVGEDFWPLLLNAVHQAVETAELRAAREQAEQEIREGKERAEILLAEVNHRVANSLALVAALIRLQTSSTDNPAVKDALAETQARISAIAGMHRSLYTSHDVRHVQMNRYIETLVADLTSTLPGNYRNSNIVCDIEPLQILSDRAVSIGVIVAELLTNAVKYAFPEEKPGAEIRVGLRRISEDAAILTVADNGIGFSQEDSPRGTGLGSRIVVSMARTIGNGISYVPCDEGTCAEIHINLQ